MLTCGWVAVASADGQTEGQTCVDVCKGGGTSPSPNNPTPATTSDPGGGGGDDSTNTSTDSDPRSSWRRKSEREGTPSPEPPPVVERPPSDPRPPPAAGSFGVIGHIASFDGVPAPSWSFETSTAWVDEVRTNPKLFGQTLVKRQLIAMAPDRRVEKHLKTIDKHSDKLIHLMDSVFDPTSGPTSGDRAAADLFGNLVDDDDDIPPADAPLPQFYELLDRWFATH
jgi:hypothetical protein